MRTSARAIVGCVVIAMGCGTSEPTPKCDPILGSISAQIGSHLVRADLTVTGTIAAHRSAIRSVSVAVYDSDSDPNTEPSASVPAAATANAVNFGQWTASVPIDLLASRAGTADARKPVRLAARATDACHASPEWLRLDGAMQRAEAEIPVDPTPRVFVDRLAIAFRFPGEAKRGIADGDTPVIIDVTTNPQGATQAVTLTLDPEDTTQIASDLGVLPPFVLSGDGTTKDATLSVPLVASAPGVVTVKAWSGESGYALDEVTALATVEFADPSSAAGDAAGG